VLCVQDSPHEQVILRDINRTFPAHDFFKEAGGSGQEALYRISKVDDVYCQRNCVHELQNINNILFSRC